MDREKFRRGAEKHNEEIFIAQSFFIGTLKFKDFGFVHLRESCKEWILIPYVTIQIVDNVTMLQCYNVTKHHQTPATRTQNIQNQHQEQQ